MRNYEKDKVEELEIMLKAGRLIDSRMEFCVSNRNGNVRTKVKLINEVEVAGMILSFDTLEKIAVKKDLKVCGVT